MEIFRRMQFFSVERPISPEYLPQAQDLWVVELALEQHEEPAETEEQIARFPRF